MGQLGYVLNREGLQNGCKTGRYYKRDLELMTNHQLREICRREKIIQGVINPLDKEDLVRVILRFRGADEHLLIRKEDSIGLVALQEVLQKARIHIQTDVHPICSAKITVYEGLAVGFYDRLTIKYEEKFVGTNALIVGAEGQICGILNIEVWGEDRDFLYFTKSADINCEESNIKDYSLYFLDRKNSELVYRIYTRDCTYVPEHLNIYQVPLLDFEVRRPVQLSMPLAIDFGTSNTTAGVYLDSQYFERSGLSPERHSMLENGVNYAVFYDVTQNGQKTTLLPSVVSVLSLDGAGPQYLFGYEAIKLANSSYIDEGFCVFYDIKRWIGSYEESEEIIDKQGHRAFVKRKEIIKAYFEYIITETMNQFKCRITTVHISSPVKQKLLFQKLFSEILPQYVIEKEDMLDEGVSVLYNTISEMIGKEGLQKGGKKEYQALIIDCGGGTTDLCSCKFKIINRRVSYKIDIETAYENGDTDFGGNNLTFRVMQILKIELASRLSKLELKPVQGLFEAFDMDIFRFVDENGTAALYREMEDEYEKAEQVIPTRFKNYERLSRADYYKVKNNFYFLFHLAERIKKEFYNKIGTLRIVLASDPVNESVTTWLPVDKWKLSVVGQEGLTTIKTFPEIYFTIYEMSLLLKGDIYGIIHRFMEEMYESRKVEDYSIIKLTGQSCKIDSFRNALKEFVPGKTIQFKRKSGDLTDDFELKMTCVDGALKYLKDKKYGYADITITNKRPALPYIITAYTHTEKEVVLIHGLRRSEATGSISRNMDDLTLKLYLKDMDGKVRYSFNYDCSLEDFRQVEDEGVHAQYGDWIQQKETDCIENREVKFFVWARPEHWGYVVVPVYRDAESLMLGKEQFFNFENDNWVTNFFDGTK